MDKKSWKEEAFRDQLSVERDFPGKTPISFRYAICCGHRTGSNLLGEALYKTGQAGDPMEYFNTRFLKAYAEDQLIENINYANYLDEMKGRRTSPNGVFGINIKIDQLRLSFGNDWKEAIRLIKDNDYVLFLYRKDRLRQAISLYIGQYLDLFNVPATVSDEVINDRVDSVPFNPKRIANCLSEGLSMEVAWLKFFKKNEIKYELLAYEELVSNYEEVIGSFLSIFHVPDENRRIPEKPMKKVANKKNEELRRMFIDFLGGNGVSNGVLAATG